MITAVPVLIAVLAVLLVLLGSSVRVLVQYERGAVFRLGRLLPETRGPGLAVVVPVADRLQEVSVQMPPAADTGTGTAAAPPAAAVRANGVPADAAVERAVGQR